MPKFLILRHKLVSYNIDFYAGYCAIYLIHVWYLTLPVTLTFENYKITRILISVSYLATHVKIKVFSTTPFYPGIYKNDDKICGTFSHLFSIYNIQDQFLSTVELQWLEHRWLVYYGCFELVLESLGKHPIAADIIIFGII